jgi:hypothetical protein
MNKPYHMVHSGRHHSVEWVAGGGKFQAAASCPTRPEYIFLTGAGGLFTLHAGGNVAPKCIAKGLDIGQPPNKADEFVALAAPEDNLFYTFRICNNKMTLGVIQRGEDRALTLSTVVVSPPEE